MMTKSHQREEIGPWRMIVMVLLMVIKMMEMKMISTTIIKSRQREVSGPGRMFLLISDESSLMMLIKMKMLTI